MCPMLGGTGVKVKVVEALSYGLPVVCTRRGVDGLPNKSRNGCLVSDEASQFARNIISLLQDQTLYSEQSRLAAELFSSHFSTERSEEHTSELQPLMRRSYPVITLKTKKTTTHTQRSRMNEHLYIL